MHWEALPSPPAPLRLLLQSEAVSCTCSWSRQAKDRGGVSGRAEGSVTSSGCAFLTQVAVELPGQHWQPYFQQDALAHMAFAWGLVHQTVFTLLNKSWPSVIGWLILTPPRLIIAAFLERVRADKTTVTVWRRGWGIRRLGLAWLPGFPLLTSTAGLAAKKHPLSWVTYAPCHCMHSFSLASLTSKWV